MDFRETFDYVCRAPATPVAVEQNDAANLFDFVTGAVARPNPARSTEGDHFNVQVLGWRVRFFS